MTQFFDAMRHYQPIDLEILTALRSKEKQAQMWYYGQSPAFYSIEKLPSNI